MIDFDLLPVPNQRFSSLLDEAWHEIEIRTLGSGACVVSIWRDNVPVVACVRALPNRPLIPYRYLEHGNFLFLTQNGEYPAFQNFGTSCRLIYASPEELEEVRNG